MTASKSFRLPLLALVICGAALLLIPPAAESVRQLDAYRLPVRLSEFTQPAFLQWVIRYGLVIEHGAWWFCCGAACMFLLMPVSLLCFMRRDYFGVLGLLVGSLAFLAFWSWLHAPL